MYQYESARSKYGANLKICSSLYLCTAFVIDFMLLKWEKVVLRSAIFKYLFLKKNILIVSDCLKIDSDIYIGIFRTICWMPQHNEQARFIGSSSKPLSRLLLYLKRKIIKYFEKDQKPNSLTILIFVPPVLMHQMIYRLFSFWVISTPQELEMIIVFLTESPYLDYTLFLFFCVS